MASIDPQPLHVVSEHEVASMANLNLLQQQGFSVPNLFAQSLMPMGPSMTQNVQPLPNANPAALVVVSAKNLVSLPSSP